MKKATQSNVMQSIVNTSQGAKVKITSVKPSLSDSDITDLAVQAGKASVGVSDAHALLASTSEVLNKVIANLKSGGFKIVDLRSKEKSTVEGKQCALFKSAFIDAVVDAGKTEKTAGIYYDAVALALKTGKPVDLNPAKKSGAKKSGDADKNPVAIVDLLAKIYNHPDYEKTLNDATQKDIEAVLLAKKYL
jgi:hypothetical protein